MEEIAGTLCVNDKGEILVLKRPDGSWDLPKGNVRSNESLRHGAARETIAELGIVPQMTGEVHTGRFQHEVSVFIFVAILPDEPITLSAAHTSYRWLSNSKAVSILHPPLARIVWDHERTA